MKTRRQLRERTREEAQHLAQVVDKRRYKRVQQRMLKLSQTNQISRKAIQSPPREKKNRKPSLSLEKNQMLKK